MSPVGKMPAGEGEPQEASPRISALSLFLVFQRLGRTAFGGPEMVSDIRELAVKKQPWLSKEMFEDGVPLCQSIPGATAMQAAGSIFVFLDVVCTTSSAER
jgi:chromate transport protein ChrA